MAPTPNYRGQVDQLLSGFSLGYAQDEALFVAGRVFPTMGVRRQSDNFYIYPKGWRMRPQVARRPLGGEPVEATYGLENGTYSVQEFALAMSLDDRERTNTVPPFDPEEEHVAFLMENHLIHREINWAKSHFTTGIWAEDLTGVASATPAADELYQWDADDSTPQKIVNKLKQRITLRCGRPANLMVVGANVHTVLCSHPEIIERTKYTSDAAITRAIIARYFEIEEYLVLEAVHNVAAELAPQFGDSVELEYIANGDGMLLLYRNPRVGLKAMTAGVTFVWQGLLGAEGFSYPVYRDRKVRAWSDWFAVRAAYGMEVLAPDCGIYVDGLISAEA